MLWYYSGLFHDYLGLLRLFGGFSQLLGLICDYLEDDLIHLGFHNHVCNIPDMFASIHRIDRAAGGGL